MTLTNLGLPTLLRTHFINTIPPDEEREFPGDEKIEKRIRRILR